MDRRKLRRLLASSSFAALLVAAGAARAQDLSNPAGSTTAFLRVNPGDVFDDVLNEGLITNGVGDPGIEIIGNGKVLGEVDNDGDIVVSDNTTATGILVRGTSALIGEGISNDGLIDVDVSGSGTGLVARGIAIEGTNTLINGANDHRGLANDGDATIDVFLRAFSNVNETAGGQATASASGNAVGMVVGTDVTLNNGVFNHGRIDVTVSSDATSIVSGGFNAQANATAGGVASGIFLEQSVLNGGFENTEDNGPAEILVLNDNFARADASAISAAAAATATAVAHAGTGAGSAFGIDIHADTILGDFNDGGVVHVTNRAFASASAFASGVTGLVNGSATASGSAWAIHVSATSLVGDLIERGNVQAISTADARLNLRAVGSGGGASANGNVVAIATGIGLQANVDSLFGDFRNSGDILVRADASAFGRVTAIETAQAAANAFLNNNVSASAFVTGVTVNGTTVSGDLTNSDTLVVDANVVLDLKAVADSFSGSALASASGKASISAHGLVFDVGTVAGDVQNDAAITMTLDLSAIARATARAEDSAAALAGVTNYRVYNSIAVYYLVDTVGGDLTNTGAIVVTADADAQLHALATATSGPARATALFEANTTAVQLWGLYTDGTSVGGDLSNSGDIALAGNLTIDIDAKASGAGATRATANLTVTGASVFLNPLAFFHDTVGGDVRNSGDVVARGEIQLVADANAVASNQAIANVDIDPSISIIAISATGVSVGGDVVNDGDVDATAVINVAAIGTAKVTSGTSSADVLVSVTMTESITGVRLDYDTVVGNMANNGDVTAVASIAVKATASAINTGEGSASAIASTSIDVQVLGVEMLGTSVGGDVSNSGDISLRARIDSENRAFASGNTTGGGGVGSAAYASVSMTSITVTVTGLQVAVDTVAGDLTNSGSVNIETTILADGFAKAVATAGTQAEASAIVTMTEIGAGGVIGVDVEFVTVFGDVRNEGSITLHSLVQAKATASAIGDERATASGVLSITVTQTGITVSGTSLGGDAVNSGDIVASVTVTATSRVFAKVTDGDNIAQASGDASVTISILGVDIDIDTVAGDAINSGDITISARIVEKLSATALNTGAGSAQALTSTTASLTLTGLQFDIDSLGGDLTNSGDIFVRGVIDIDAKAIATGAIDAAGAIAFAASASAKMTDDSVTATGLSVDVDTMDGNFLNSGSITVVGTLSADALAKAVATGGANDEAFAFVSQTSVDLDLIGADIFLGTVGGDVTNTGDVVVVGKATINATASALSPFDANASAVVTQSSTATGLSFSGDTINGRFHNEGNVTVQLTVDHSVKAVATVSELGGTAAATISADFTATASGLVFEVDTVLGGWSNSGNVSVAIRNVNDVAATAVNSGSGNATASASVTNSVIVIGIDVNSTQIDGGLSNSGDIFAQLVIDSDVSANATAASENAVATVHITSGSATVTGALFSVDTLNGDFSNSGNVVVRGTVDIAGFAEAFVTTAGKADVTASATISDISVSLLGLEVDSDTLVGNLTNSGNVTILGDVAVGVTVIALASGATGSASAIVGANDAISLTATGVLLEVDTMTGDLSNSGDVAIQAKATVLAEARATAANGDAIVDVSVSFSINTVLGLEVDISTLVGDLENSGNITLIVDGVIGGDGINNAAHFTAVASSNAKASVKATLSATADSVTGALFQIDTMTGTFTNSGDITISVENRVNLDAKASGGTSAVVFVLVAASISATGMLVEMDTLTGDASNSGDISVFLTNVIGGVTTGGAPTALLLAKATNGNASASLSNSILTAFVSDGLEFDVDTLFGNLSNSGNISARARNILDLEISALASNGSAFARASQLDEWFASVSDALQFEVQTISGDVTNSGNVSGFAQVDAHLRAHASASAVASALIRLSVVSVFAQGVTFDIDTASGDLTNSGNVAIIAAATLDFEATADGTNVFASAFISEATVRATGIVGEAIDTLGGNFLNSGNVQVNASADFKLLADANGTATSTGTAFITAFSSVSAFGIDLEIATALGDVVNSGQVLVRADIEATVSAFAAGATAKAVATVATVTAEAVGYRLNADTVAGDFRNSSTVQAFVEVDLLVVATAPDNARASITNVSAFAAGMWASSFGTLGGNFVNDGGLIIAVADVNGRARATGATNIATAHVHASATGMVMDAGSLAGSMVNDGTLRVSALAFASATAFGGTESATATAHASGMRLDIDSLGGDVRNDGLILVKASASAVGAKNTAKATAYGIRATVTVANGSVINDGTILASATANAPALVVGQAIGGGNWSGALNNASDGFIDVFASDPAKATAIGMRIEGTAIVQGGIVNAGTVLAEAVATGTVIARAIDLSKATATGHTVHMLDGLLRAVTRTTAAAATSVATAVYMADNAKADTLEWSGGLIEANIIGDQGSDNLDVFAGVDDVLNFSHLIDGLQAIDVNNATHAATEIEFRINGVVANVSFLNVNENGTLVVGRGASINVSSYNQDPAGTVLFEIEPGNNNNGVITVNNTANLDGTIGIRALAGLYFDSQTYLVIDGNLNGTFDNTEVNTPLLSLAVEQTSPDVVLTVTRNDFASVPGLTENQSELGDALDDFYDPVALAGSEIGEVVGELFTLNTDELLDAYDELHGAEYAQMAYAAFESMEFVLGGVNQRLHDARSRSSGAGQSASLGNQSLQYAAINAGEGVQGTQMASIGNDPDHPGSVWGKGYGSWGKLDGDDEAPGYDRTTGAIVVGLDYRFDQEFLVGIVGAYSFSNLDFDDGDNGDIDSFQIGVFGSWDSGTWYVDGLVSYAFQSYDTERHIDFGTISEKADADYDGGAVQVYGEVGYQFEMGQQALLTPLLGLGYTSVWTSDFTEEGASGANLRVDDASFDSLATTLGVRGSLALDGWEPSLFLGWRHEFLDDHGEADVAFAAVPDSKWQVIGSDVGSDAGLVGVGVVAEISAQFEAVIDYGGQFSGSGTNHTGSIGLRLKF